MRAVKIFPPALRYQKLESESHEGDEESANSDANYDQYAARSTERLAWVFTTAVLLMWIIFLYYTREPIKDTDSSLYSYENGFHTDIVAAVPHISLESIVYTGGVEKDANDKLFLNLTGSPIVYVGDPSPEIDQNWENLESAIDIILNRTETTTKDGGIINTMKEPGEKGMYRVSVDVIHSLHCVNQLRKVIYAEHYFPKSRSSDFFFVHMNHCVEHLRQAIQCHSDLTPLVYRWDETTNLGGPVWTSKHTCRNFSKLLEWDRTRAAPDLNEKMKTLEETTNTG